MINVDILVVELVPNTLDNANYLGDDTGMIRDADVLGWLMRDELTPDFKEALKLAQDDITSQYLEEVRLGQEDERVRFLGLTARIMNPLYPMGKERYYYNYDECIGPPILRIQSVEHISVSEVISMCNNKALNDRV